MIQVRLSTCGLVNSQTSQLDNSDFFNYGILHYVYALNLTITLTPSNTDSEQISIKHFGELTSPQID